MKSKLEERESLRCKILMLKCMSLWTNQVWYRENLRTYDTSEWMTSHLTRKEFFKTAKTHDLFLIFEVLVTDMFCLTQSHCCLEVQQYKKALTYREIDRRLNRNQIHCWFPSQIQSNKTQIDCSLQVLEVQ